MKCTCQIIDFSEGHFGVLLPASERLDAPNQYFKLTEHICYWLAIAQDGNQNILPIAFAIVEGETVEARYFILSNLHRHVVT